MKKGRSSWKPPLTDLVRGKKPGWVYRWVDKDQANVWKKQDWGWQMASKVHGDTATVESPDSNDGKTPTTVMEHRERVLMMIPEDEYQAHREYFEEKTRQNTMGLKERAKEAEAKLPLSGRAGRSNVTGHIIIS